MAIPDWAKLPGTLLPGGYEVEQCLGAAETSAKFRVRILGDRFTTAVGEFFAPGTVPSQQVDVWFAATALRHQNVSAPLAAGVHTADGKQIPYFIEVQPDETLDGVIRERTLTIEEVREVTRAMIEALAYLHAHGFTQVHVQPSSVAAIGDRVCLRLPDVRQTNTPLIAGEEASMDNDVRGLGETVFAVLTRKEWKAEVPADIEKLPKPFDFLVERCTEKDPQKRCNLGEAKAILRGEVVAPKKAAPAPIATPRPTPIEPLRPLEPATPRTVLPTEPKLVPVAKETIAAKEPPKEPVREVVKPPVLPQALGPKPSIPEAIGPVIAPAGPVRRQWYGEEPVKKRASLMFYIPVAAILLAALLLWVMRPKQHTAPKPGPVATFPSHEVGPAPTAAPPSPSAVPVPKQTPAAAQRAGEPASKNGYVWRVVAFTFNRESDAKKRADAITAQHPGFEASVFTPNGRAPYLVALGGAMSRAQAEQLRRKARASGLPRDTYIQNYNH